MTTRKSPEKEIKVLLTGFGPFQDIATNPSFEIISRLPSNLPNNPNVKLIAHPTPIPVSYHSILTLTPQLLTQYDPDIVVNVGLDNEVDFFRLEQSTQREGYHDIPAADRRVFTRAENKKVFGKAAASLSTSLDLESAVQSWQDGVSGLTLPAKPGDSDKSKGKAKGKANGRPVDVRLSDDVGNYVCGFIYYVGLLEQGKRKDGRRDVVFLHVPYLEGSEEIRVGVGVVEAAVTALIEGWKGR